MTSNVDNRGQGPRFHYTSQTSYLSATFIAAAQTPYAPNQYIGSLNQSVSAPQPSLNIVPNAAGTYQFQLPPIPYGARILRQYIVTAIAWAGATTSFTAGNAAGGAQYAAAAAFPAVGTNVVALVASVATYVELVDATPTWTQVVISAGTLTAGQSDYILEYTTTHGPQGEF